MIEVLIAFALGAASSGAAFFVAQRAAKAERADLENRLMCRDWTEYRALTDQRPQHDVPQLTSDQAEAAWYAAHARETGEAA